MRARDEGDISRFVERATPLLMEDEARHNLLLGISHTLRTQPDAYPRWHAWLVEEGGDVLGAALMTPPNNLILSAPRSEAALGELARLLHRDGVALPGVTAALPEAERFADAWAELTPVTATRAVGHGIYRLTMPRRVRPADGRVRPAGPGDRALLVDWCRAFTAEASPTRPDEAFIDRMVDTRLASEDAGMWLWEDPAPVSLAGFGGRTPNGIRVGPVYTPLEHRGRGYATSLVATLSGWLLEQGRRFCFLYADLDNPTANRIYERIGYEYVCGSVELRFHAAATSGPSNRRG